MASPPARKPVPLPFARWPDAAEAAASRLYSPLALGPIVARHRTWVPAMVPWRATEDGFVTQANLDWYGRFAAGQPGTLVAEATGIRDVPSGPLLRIGHDRFIPGLAGLVQRVREGSAAQTRFLLQILDFLVVRRRPTPERYFSSYLAVDDRLRAALASVRQDDSWRDAPESKVRAALLAGDEALWQRVLSPREWESLAFGFRERVSDMWLPHVRDLPRELPALFASAARRAVEAGFDGIELHFAHAYTMASFLSRLNDRNDGYGGNLAGRQRLALEVIAAVRAEVGSKTCVGARFLGDDVVAGGSRLEEACAHGVAFAAAGLDFLSISKGGRFEDAKQPRVGHAVYPYTGPSGHECMPTVRIDEAGPFARNLPLAAAIRHAVRAAGYKTPVVAAGGFCTFDRMERALADGHADAIASARQSLADPDWFEKMRLGRGAEIRRCVFTNYCEGLDQMHKEVTCKLWDKEVAADDRTTPRAQDGRRRLLAPDWPR